MCVEWLFKVAGDSVCAEARSTSSLSQNKNDNSGGKQWLRRFYDSNGVDDEGW